MKKNIITVAAIGIGALLLAACTTNTATNVQPVQPSPTAVNQIDPSISGQIDISDDAVTAREATKSGKSGKASTAPVQNSY